MIGVIDDADRPWSAPLPRDEPTTLQSLDHLIHGGCGDEEVLPDIRFGWRNTEPEDVPCDERKVLALTAGGLKAVAETFSRRVAGSASQGGDEALLKQLDGENRVIGEVDFESSSVRLRNVRHRPSGHVLGDVLYVDGHPSHGSHSLRLTRDLRPNAQAERAGVAPGRSSLLLAFTARLAILPDRRIAMKMNDCEHEDLGLVDSVEHPYGYLRGIARRTSR